MPKIIIPKTIDELLDITANIYRHVGGRFDGPTLSALYPPAGLRDMHEDLVIFYNSGLPLCVWPDKSSGGLVKYMEKEWGRSEHLYAYRLNSVDVLRKFPVYNLQPQWIEWVRIDITEKELRPGAWDGSTQFIGE